MILVDSSVWIDHLRMSEPRLVGALEADEVGVHPLVVEEIAVGSIKRRGSLLQALRSLHEFPRASHDEVMALVERQRLWGRGLSPVHVHLLASTMIRDGALLWTRDKHLRRTADELGMGLVAWR